MATTRARSSSPAESGAPGPPSQAARSAASASALHLDIGLLFDAATDELVLGRHALQARAADPQPLDVLVGHQGLLRATQVAGLFEEVLGLFAHGYSPTGRSASFHSMKPPSSQRTIGKPYDARSRAASGAREPSSSYTRIVWSVRMCMSSMFCSSSGSSTRTATPGIHPSRAYCSELRRSMMNHRGVAARMSSMACRGGRLRTTPGASGSREPARASTSAGRS